MARWDRSQRSTLRQGMCPAIRHLSKDGRLVGGAVVNHSCLRRVAASQREVGAMERLFTVPDAWRGGYVELALELGPPSDDRMGAALAALWAHPTLDGPYAERDREPWDQPRLA